MESLADLGKLFKDKTVLITGGTGFLGRNLIAEILKHEPHSIRVFSRDEVKQHNVQEKFKSKKVRALVGDVRDYERLKTAMKGVDFVIHAAAMKRVDMIEYNSNECIKTNILGTMNVVQACIENNIEKAVYVSTDKACLPVNTYGASKFIGERIFTESNYSKGKARTAFLSVRYGNVVDSTGSLIPAIKEKLLNGEDLDLTDSRMTRFFISPSQAVQLIFTALKYGVGGELFVPKLPAFKVLDVLELFNEKSGKNKKINIVGIRPGEKLHELMINSSESPRTFEFDGFFVITSQIENYQQDIRYSYLHSKKKVGFSEYSSENSVISKGDIKEALEKQGVL